MIRLARTPKLLFHVRWDMLFFLAGFRQHHDYGFPMIDPHAYLWFYNFHILSGRLG